MSETVAEGGAAPGSAEPNLAEPNLAEPNLAEPNLAEPGLAVIGVSKRFGEFVAVHPLDLALAPGELVALLGPSGCGKTTTLRMVAGFEAPDSGEVRIAGRNVTNVPPHERKLGMVFQNYSLFPHMTVAENVAFGLRMHGIARAERDTRVRRVLDTVQLEPLLDRYPAQLSGGQQQRVALARSLVVNPLVLLLDEPLGALDKNLREAMQFELRTLQRRIGITSLLVTHDQEEALSMCDRVAVMNRGRIEQSGTPDEIYDRPRTRFVATFLGTSNIITGRAAPGTAMLAGPHRDVPVALPAPAPREEVVLSVRPERIRLGAAAEGLANAFGAKITSVAFRGTYSAFELHVEALALDVYAYRFSDEAGRFDASPGSELRIGWRPQDGVLVGDAP